MLKIKTIEFIKAVYDESISHNVFSIANITFSNYPPIYGALLYWRKNEDEKSFTDEDEYKFFYDMADIQYYASVKYPKSTRLTKDQRQELSYILLEERGSVGSYSFSTNEFVKPFSPKKELMNLALPLNESMNLWNDEQTQLFQKWQQQAVKQHPSKLVDVMEHLTISQLCMNNPYLSEQFLIDHLDEIDYYALQYNRPVLERLTKCFKEHLVNELTSNLQFLQSEIAEDVDYFIEADDFYSEYQVVYLKEVDELQEEELFFFEYDLGPYIWPGSEHLVEGIPSLVSQLYDRYGDKKLTNKEMAKKIKNYSETQIKLFSGMAQLYWLAEFKNLLDWTTICAYNPHLTEEFIIAHEEYIEYRALGLNSKIKLSEAFIATHFRKFNHNQPVPLVICHLTEQFYLMHKDDMIMDRELLLKYGDAIDAYEYLLLEDLIE